MGLGQAWCLSALALVSSAYALPAFKETFDDGAVPCGCVLNNAFAAVLTVGTGTEASGDQP